MRAVRLTLRKRAALDVVREVLEAAHATSKGARATLLSEVLAALEAGELLATASTRKGGLTPGRVLEVLRARGVAVPANPGPAWFGMVGRKLTLGNYSEDDLVAAIDAAERPGRVTGWEYVIRNMDRPTRAKEGLAGGTSLEEGDL